MITGIILASGFSSRMGRDKLLLNFEGEKIIEKVIKASKKSNLDEVILVYRKKEVGIIGKKYGINTVYNGNSYLGQSQSVKLGILNSNNRTKGYMFLVGDQPYLTHNIINKIIKEFYNKKNHIIVPYFAGKKGNPVLFPLSFKKQLLNIEGDKGGRAIIEKNPNSVYRMFFRDKKLGIDIDSPNDLVMYKEGIYEESSNC